ncbi:hypothetical protein A4E84_12310 [Streptomyces qaidamensis]|uniref:Glycosyl transferase family 51 domain-containing protein n=1 Tax=Streptomyces qaidamensis TaxID=1783515 RepID=A0A143BYL4_9ACTN|nr:hypothetical protein A4E84_12310 [Streptomyces qaidamensis]
MARTGWGRRQAMPLKDIPEDVRDAVPAAENASFHSDPGISLRRSVASIVASYPNAYYYACRT